MLPLTVCVNGSSCCIQAGGALQLLPGHSPPARVFFGVNRDCSDSDRPISSPNGSPAAGWVEAASITSLESDAYNIGFPAFSGGDPRCVSTCDNDYPVCVWTYYADGSSSCEHTQVNPADICEALPQGCPECVIDP
jgi:hypothetical protein